jgi:choline-sulfatase
MRPTVFLIATLAVQQTIACAPPRAPNVLVICADDHAAHVTGAYGNQQVRTPHIDRLAAGGIRFEQAYCNSPVCTASRQSFFTGRYPRTIGVTQLKTALPDSEVTLAETLDRAGYATAGIGKMHFNSKLKHGFALRIDTPEYHAWLAGQPKDAATLTGVQSPWRPFKDPARIWLNAAALPIGQADARMEGTYFAQQAAAYLNEARDKPFFLMVSFNEPHSPFRFPLEYRGRHKAAEFTAPALGAGDDAQIPAVFRDLSPADKQGIAAAYYTSVEFMDKNVGLVLDALEQSGQATDTIVIYLSDHGYLLGQHGRFEKHTSYEEAVRTPLVIRYPRRIGAGRVSHAFVELVDLAPTIHSLCDLAISGPLQGRTLMPLLAGKTTKHRDHVVVEYAPNEEAMIRDDYWKLVYERGAVRRTDGYDTERPLVPNRFRLYDLHQDPAEIHNVAADPANAATLVRLRDLLIDHLSTTARDVTAVPQGDPLATLEYCVQSRDE